MEGMQFYLKSTPATIGQVVKSASLWTWFVSFFSLERKAMLPVRLELTAFRL